LSFALAAGSRQHWRNLGRARASPRSSCRGRRAPAGPKCAARRTRGRAPRVPSRQSRGRRAPAPHSPILPRPARIRRRLRSIIAAAEPLAYAHAFLRSPRTPKLL
jgi:hypothetical protein